MHTLLLIPGIIGSKLKLGNREIWPPYPIEIATHYSKKHVKDLLKPAVVSSGIIQEIACYPVYRPLETTLLDIANKMKPKARVDRFDYDWRQNWRDIAKALSKKLEKLAKTNSEISIVGHSMGAMIARLVLEDPSEDPSWLPKVKRLIAICAPHLGAPHAVADALGLYGLASGIVRKSDTKKIAADPRYPSGYQLFTRPDRPVVFKDSQPLDLYDCEDATKLRLSCANAKAAKDLFPLFDLMRQPPGCDYRFISGNGYPETIDSLKTTNYRKFSEVYSEGDSTVPVWSTNPSPATIPTYTMKGDHVGIMGTPQCKALLHTLFGVKASADVFMVRKTPLITLSLGKRVYDKGERIDVLVIPGKPTRMVSGSYQILRAGDRKGRKLTRYGSVKKIEYRGLRFESMNEQLKAPDEPGLYKLVFEGSHRTNDDTAAHFVVRRGR